VGPRALLDAVVFSSESLIFPVTCLKIRDDEKCIDTKIFWQENFKGRDHLERLDVDNKIMLCIN
jgi:hypothetical protein